MTIDNNDIILLIDMKVDNKIYCNGQILFDDLDNNETFHEYKIYRNFNVNGDLFIDGNIIINNNIYSKEKIYKNIKYISDNEINKTMTIKCHCFKIGSKFTSKDNFIFTTNSDVLSNLRGLKINKLRKNAIKH